MSRAVWSIVIAVPIVGLLWFGLGRNPNAVADPLVGKPAPTFALKSLDGRTVSLASLRGRPVVLNFWATWCADCKVEHPYLLHLARAYARRGVAFVQIGYQDADSSARSFLRRYGAPGTALQDPGGATAIGYGVTGVPETFVIDQDGIVRYHSPGPVAPGAATTPGDLSRYLDKVVRGRI